MKKVVLFLILIFSGLSIAKAQVLVAALFMAGKKNERIDVGLKLGANFVNLSLNPATNIDGTLNSKLALNVGVTFDYALSKSKIFYLMSGLELSNKGVSINDVPAIETQAFPFLQQQTLSDLGSPLQNASFSMRYMQLPIHLGYKLAVSKSTKLVFRGGTYLAYATGGYLENDDIKLNIFGNLATEKDILIKRFDMGLGGALGAEFASVRVTMGYDFGLVDFDKTDNSAKHGVGNISVGYQF